MSVQYFTLNTGAKIPSVGLGTWQSVPGVVGGAVEAAIKETLKLIKKTDEFVEAGYRHIDCARAYQNEKEIGLTLKKLIDGGVVKREELFITSKLWSYDQAPEDVPYALDTSLNELGLDYLDLYLIHWPFRMRKGSWITEKPDIAATWAALEKLYDSGKIRAIGVSNFTSRQIKELLAGARIPPAVNQVECHPVWQQERLQAFCESNGIHLSAYSPLGSPGTSWIKENVLENSVIKQIAETLGKTPAQIALRWGIQKGHSVLPKTTNESRAKENFDIFSWSIPEDLFAKFSDIPQARLVRGEFFISPEGIHKSIEEIWDGEL